MDCQRVRGQAGVLVEPSNQEGGPDPRWTHWLVPAARGWLISCPSVVFASSLLVLSSCNLHSFTCEVAAIRLRTPQPALMRWVFLPLRCCTRRAGVGVEFHGDHGDPGDILFAILLNCSDRRRADGGRSPFPRHHRIGRSGG